MSVFGSAVLCALRALSVLICGGRHNGEVLRDGMKAVAIIVASWPDGMVGERFREYFKWQWHGEVRFFGRKLRCDCRKGPDGGRWRTCTSCCHASKR